ncbi:MAG TPA: nicotinate-nucleotide adenylyltransferase [Gemmatimonadaceae bacterium]
MRLGIFGGSFDPPHLGHLLPVIDAVEALALDGVRFVPAGEQPLKSGRAYASAEHRFAMTQRLLHGVPGLVADRSEIDRSGLSFTVDTVTQLAAAHPGVELMLLLGTDAFALFEQWKEPERIRSLATVVVLARGDEPLAAATRTPAQVLQTRRVDISSTELRARVADGRTIRGFVPDAVADYIAAHRLYR